MKKFSLVCFLALGVSSFLHAELLWEFSTIAKQAELGDSEVVVVFPFKANGSRTSILSIRTSCGCTTAALDKMTYDEGEKGALEVHFNLDGRSGKQSKTVYVTTDAKNHPTKELLLEVDIPKMVSIQPRFLYWLKGEGAYLEQMMKVSFHQPGIRIKKIYSDQKNLAIRWEHADDEMGANLTLKPEIPEGESPFYRAIVRIEFEADVPLRDNYKEVHVLIRKLP